MGYHYKMLKINLKMYRKLTALAIAGRLLKLVNRISPELMNTYDKTVIEHYLHSGKIGIKWQR
jgi:hypothetical protein